MQKSNLGVINGFNFNKCNKEVLSYLSHNEYFLNGKPLLSDLIF